MGEFSIWHWLVVLLVVMLLFGGGKVSGLMGDLAKGIKSFKAVMAEDDGKTKAAPPAAQAQATPPPQAGVLPAEVAATSPTPSGGPPGDAAPAVPQPVSASSEAPDVKHAA